MMKVITNTQYGSADVLQQVEMPVPDVLANQVLVKIHATSINPLDWHIMRGTPYFMRLTMGLFKPKLQILGADIAGEVVAVGEDVQNFAIGDAVFGDLVPTGLGGLADYVAVEESGLVKKPDNLSYEQAASVPIAALTAWHALHRFGPVEPGQKILVNGASGGVGTFVVQMAKAMGAEVTGVCSTRNLELVRSIGASRVVDYTKEDFTREGIQYDLIVDNVANRSIADLKRCLLPQGKAAVVGFSTVARLFNIFVLGGLYSSKKGKEIRMVDWTYAQKDLEAVTEMLAAGKVVPVIDREYPLEKSAEAIHYLEAGRARGKVIIKVA